MTAKPPPQRPGRSEQTVGTPPEFIAAAEARFGLLDLDLAALSSNRCAPDYFGPDHTDPELRDSLALDWTELGALRCWLNPPFGKIEPWARKCAETTNGELEISPWIFLLVPASVGSEWFARWVYGKARVDFLRPRLKFVGHEQSYPKDLMLCTYGGVPGTGLWRWDGK